MMENLMSTVVVAARSAVRIPSAVQSIPTVRADSVSARFVYPLPARTAFSMEMKGTLTVAVHVVLARTGTCAISVETV